MRKLRITGGEPLVRKGVMGLFESLGRHLKTGALDELTLTTNGSQLPRHAEGLYAAGVRRINISLDTRDPAKFADITRWGRLDQVLEGIEAAHAAGLKVKINTVALRGVNEDEIESLIEWCAAEGQDITFIETMPLGDIDGDRTEHYLPLSLVRARLRKRWTLDESDHRTGGPARYVTVRETGQRIWVSSRRSPTTSANPATGFALPAPARSTCAWARRTRPTCAPRSAGARATRCWSRRFTRRSGASRRATTSSLTAATPARRSAAT